MSVHFVDVVNVHKRVILGHWLRRLLTSDRFPIIHNIERMLFPLKLRFARLKINLLFAILIVGGCCCSGSQLVHF